MTRRRPGLWRFELLGIVSGILIRAGDSASGAAAFPAEPVQSAIKGFERETLTLCRVPT